VTDAAHELRIEHPRFRDAIASIAATLRQVDKDAIIGEDLRLRRRALRLAWAAATGLAVLAGASLAGGATAIRQAEEARREQVRATQWADRRLFTITLILARQVEGDRTFSSVSYDNFQGLDFGMYLGWDQRTGRLQRLLAAMYAADQPLFEQVLADGDAELARALLAIPREPSRDGQGDARFDLGSQTWQDRFRRAGELVPFQRVQLDEALRDFSANLAAVQTQMPELRTERAIAFMVDVMTQHGRGAATRFYQQARAGHTEEAILDKVSELSVAQAKRALPQAARAFERRRQLFRTTPFLLDVTVSGTDLPRPSWREDILDWSQRMAKGILAPVRPTGATQK
jgi:hypothetical protein